MKFIIFFINLISIHCYYPADLRENTISNTCEFNKIRFFKKDVLCVDYGINNKYCDHYSLSDEFIIEKEKGVNNIDNYIIKPDKIIEQTNNYKKTIANFYFSFTCDYIENYPKLLLTIIPTSDNIINEKYVIFLITLFLCLFTLYYFNIVNEDNLLSFIIILILLFYNNTLYIYNI